MIGAQGRLPRRLAALALAALAATTIGAAIAQEPPHSAALDAAIIRAAKRHGVPEHLVRRIVMRESRYNPRARNHSFWGLMQISYPTAKSMGFKGTPEQLLNPVTNLAYAVPYLANAFIIAGRREDAAVRLYASGYYATAKNRGLLSALRTANSSPLNGVPDEPAEATGPAQVAATETGSGWSLFGTSAPAPAAAPGQQLAYAATPDVAAAPAQAQIQAIARPAPAPAAASRKSANRVADKNADDGVAMVAGRDGEMAPPKRWQHDGGTSTVPRGEQSQQHLAAIRLGEEPAGRRRSRKTAVFAQLEGAGVVAASPPTATDAQPQPVALETAAPAQAAQAQTQDPREAAAHVAAAEAAGAPATADDGDAKPKRRHRHKR